MGRVTAWKCVKTGTLFETERSYRRHLCERRYKQTIQERRDHLLQTAEARVAEVRRMTSFEEIENWLNSNTDALFALAEIKGGAFNAKRWEMARKKRIKPTAGNFRLKKMRWEQIATTHSAPIGRKTTGWGKEPAERHPGWRGQITFQQSDCVASGSDLLRGIGINTGSGGGGGSNYSYEVSLYAEDFPELLEAMRREGRLNPSIPVPLPLPSPVPAVA